MVELAKDIWYKHIQRNYWPKNGEVVVLRNTPEEKVFNNLVESTRTFWLHTEDIFHGNSKDIFQGLKKKNHVQKEKDPNVVFSMGAQKKGGNFNKKVKRS